MIKEYCKKGYFVFDNCINKKIIQQILKDIQDLYRRQFKYLNLDEDTLGFNECLIQMFNKDLKRYIHANRTATMLPSIYNLAYNDSIINALVNLGLKNPILCQKPTLRMDCKKLAISQEYYKLPLHQDYKSMQGSINSVVVSVPLVDVDEDLGALMVVAGSHTEGFFQSNSSLENKSKLDALKAVEIQENKLYNKFISVKQKQGDILVISSFLLHKSGNNKLDNPRYTLLIRYNDYEDNHFLEQGFISPFRTTHESVVDDKLDYKSMLKKYFFN